MTFLSDSKCCLEPVSYAAVEEDCTSGLVKEVVDDLDKVCADVVLLHGCPQSCLLNPVKGLLEVYEDMVEVLLVLEIFLREDSVKYLQHQQKVTVPCIYLRARWSYHRLSGSSLFCPLTVKHHYFPLCVDWYYIRFIF